MKAAKKLHISVVALVLALILLPQMASAQNNDRNNGQKQSFLSGIFRKKGNTENEKTVNVTKRTDPVISFDKKFFDYGDIVQSSEGIAEFTVTNTGSGNLFITDVESSCGCLIIDYPDYAIKENKSAVIRVKYNTNIVGEIRRSITVVCNDRQHKRTTLTLTGNVILKND